DCGSLGVPGEGLRARCDFAGAVAVKIEDRDAVGLRRVELVERERHMRPLASGEWRLLHRRQRLLGKWYLFKLPTAWIPDRFVRVSSQPKRNPLRTLFEFHKERRIVPLPGS